MKVFVFTVEVIKPKKDNAFHNRVARVYEIKKNIPTQIGWTSYRVGLSKGHESKVFNYLMDKGYIPKKLHSLSKELYGSGEGFYVPAIEDKGYKIIRME